MVILNRKQSLNNLELDTKKYMHRKIIFGIRLFALMLAVLFLADAYLFRTNITSLIVFAILGIIFLFIYGSNILRRIFK